MERGGRSTGVLPSVVAVGHIAVGLAALVCAAVLLYRASRPFAGLEGAFGPVGAFLGLFAGTFLVRSVQGLREARRGHIRTVVTLSICELVVGLILAVAVANAASGYTVFGPWRSPLFVPTIVLIVFGFAGLALKWLPDSPSSSGQGGPV